MADDLASSGLMLHGIKQDGLSWEALATSRRMQTESMVLEWISIWYACSSADEGSC
jgi:hypothetical protein